MCAYVHSLMILPRKKMAKKPKPKDPLPRKKLQAKLSLAMPSSGIGSAVAASLKPCGDANAIHSSAAPAMSLCDDSFDPIPHPLATAALARAEPTLGASGMQTADVSWPAARGHRRQNMTSPLFSIVLNTPFFRASAK
jgi:hypothetical protein